MEFNFEIIRSSDSVIADAGLSFRISSVKQDIDNLSDICTKCKLPFSWYYRRKHHCRIDGHIYCFECTNKKIDIYTDEKGDQYLDMISYRNNSSIKVCNDCYSILQLKRGIGWLPIIFYRLHLIDVLRIASVCKLWNIIAKNYIYIYENIKTKLPSHLFTQIEITILKANTSQFYGHSKWLVPVFKCCNINIEILTYPRIKECKELNCGEGCYIQLKGFHLLDLLINSTCSIELLTYIYECLDKLSDIELDCYIPHFVKLLTKYPSFIGYLAKRSNQSIIIATDVYFQLLFNNNLAALFDCTALHKLHSMRNTCDVIKNGKLDILKGIIYEPTHPDEEYIGINIAQIKEMDSYHAPQSIPFVKHDGSINRILFKHDNLLPDQIVSKIIILFDQILREEEGLDCHTVKYRVVPLDLNNGLIEIVGNAETLESLKVLRNFSMQNYVRIHNKNMTFQEWDDRITKSCAFCCIISYLLGIGDRHLGNIMMTSSGQLFHIDFSYLLGLDPKFAVDTIRITADMIDALGGTKSEIYKNFEDMCIKIYLCARRHLNLFVNMLAALTGNGITQEHIGKVLCERFDLYSNDLIAAAGIKYKLKSSARSYKFVPVDIIHGTSKMYTGISSSFFSQYKLTMSGS